MNARAKPVCLQAVPFRDRYVTTDRISAVEAESYFLPIAHHLRRGDVLDVESHPPDGREVRFASYFVARSDPDAVIVRRVGDVAACRLDPDPAKPEPRDEARAVAWKGGRKWCVMDGGRELCSGIADKPTALRIAAGDLPIPEPEREEA